MTATATPASETLTAPVSRFEYGYAQLKDFSVQTSVDKLGRTQVHTVSINGRVAKPSPRFWLSLQCRFGFTQNIFKYFRHDEVFNRISTTAANDRLRWCLHHNGESVPTLLAVTNPRTAAATYDDVSGLLNKYGTHGLNYAKGVVRSTHTPRLGGAFNIAGDDFRPRFVIDAPIDGFGRPAIYLSLLRGICSNGAVAFAPAFRSELNVGKGDDGVQFALTRALDGFNNEDGFVALRQRFESAAKSWASVNEVNKLYKVLVRVNASKGVRDVAVGGGANPAGGDGASTVPYGSPLFRSFHRMTGDLTRAYGLANLDTLSIKRQRTLPTGCRVYDLLNFASELATHHTSPEAGRTVQAFIGGIVSTEYDLENTVDQFADWQDFFIADRATIDTLSEIK